MTGAQSAKQKAVQNLYERVEEKGPFPRDKLLAQMRLDAGLSEGKSKEWLEDFLTAGYFEENDDGEIYVPEEDD